MVGKPVHGLGGKLLSSWPLNIAVKAAELADAEKAPLFLHRLREASTARGLTTTRDDVMLSIAAGTGIDLQRFTEALRDGSAKKLFEADKNYAASLGITGFPTCIVEYGEKKVMLKGYNSYESFVSVIDEISGGKVRPRKPAANGEAILELLAKYGRLAVEELRQAFEFPDQLALRAALDELLVQNRLRIEKAGNGYIVELAEQGCSN